jgi:hypothetical protein
MAKQAATHDEAGGDPEHRAPEAHFSLVNPSTGLANDYLNVFNEILLLLEFLPSMPEMTDDALAWRPRGYREYFHQSPLPGANEALHAYEKMDPRQRARFETHLRQLTDFAVKAQRKVAEESLGPNYPESIVEVCEILAAAMRDRLANVARLINEGAPNGKRAPKPTQSQDSGF